MKLSIRVEAPENNEKNSSGADEGDSTGNSKYPNINAEKISEVLKSELEEIYPASKNFERAEISVTFMNSEDIQELNKTYRNIDEPTDVLSFPMLDDDIDVPEMPLLLLGDIVICPEQVEKLHPELKLQDALYLMIAHSFLHLLGYDHDTEEKQIEMWEKQDDIKNKMLEAIK